MNVRTVPHVEVVPLGSRVQVEITYSPELWQVGIRLAIAGAASFWFYYDWKGSDVFDKAWLVLLALGVLTDLLRLFLTRQVIDISREQISVKSESLISREKTYSAAEVTGICYHNEKEDNRYLSVRMRRKPSIDFGYNIANEDAWRVLEAIGTMGGIGVIETASDEKHFITLGLNS